MKRNKEYDEEIKSMLVENAKQIEPSKELFDKITKDIYEGKDKEIMRNKVRGFKKSRRVAVMVASLILIGSLTVMGVRIGKSWVGSSNSRYNTFPSQEKVLKDVGFLPKYPKSLPGGFEYVSGGTGTSTLSDSGNDLTETREVSLAYKNESEESLVHLSISQIDEVFIDNEESELVGKLNGIDLYYYNKDYKFVPVDYELTKEDKKAMEMGELEISYGASEISFSDIQSLSWYEDGLQYMIMGDNHNFTVEEMIDMAKVIIRQ